MAASRLHIHSPMHAPSCAVHDLAAAWLARAEELGPYNPGAAHAWREAARELEAAQVFEANELLDRPAAAAAAGVDPDSITRAIRKGRLLNYGTAGNPRVRRSDVLAAMSRRAAAPDPAPVKPLRVAGGRREQPSSQSAADLGRAALAGRLGRSRHR